MEMAGEEQSDQIATDKERSLLDWKMASEANNVHALKWNMKPNEDMECSQMMPDENFKTEGEQDMLTLPDSRNHLEQADNWTESNAHLPDSIPFSFEDCGLTQRGQAKRNFSLQLASLTSCPVTKSDCNVKSGLDLSANSGFPNNNDRDHPTLDFKSKMEFNTAAASTELTAPHSVSDDKNDQLHFSGERSSGNHITNLVDSHVDSVRSSHLMECNGSDQPGFIDFYPHRIQPLGFSDYDSENRVLQTADISSLQNGSVGYPSQVSVIAEIHASPETQDDMALQLETNHSPEDQVDGCIQASAATDGLPYLPHGIGLTHVACNGVNTASLQKLMLNSNNSDRSFMEKKRTDLKDDACHTEQPVVGKSSFEPRNNSKIISPSDPELEMDISPAQEVVMERRGSKGSLDRFLAPALAVTRIVSTPFDDPGFAKVPGYLPELSATVEEVGETILPSDTNSSCKLQNLTPGENPADISDASSGIATTVNSDDSPNPNVVMRAAKSAKPMDLGFGRPKSRTSRPNSLLGLSKPSVELMTCDEPAVLLEPSWTLEPPPEIEPEIKPTLPEPTNSDAGPTTTALPLLPRQRPVFSMSSAAGPGRPNTLSLSQRPTSWSPSPTALPGSTGTSKRPCSLSLSLSVSKDVTSAGGGPSETKCRRTLTSQTNVDACSRAFIEPVLENHVFRESISPCLSSPRTTCSMFAMSHQPAVFATSPTIAQCQEVPSANEPSTGKHCEQSMSLCGVGETSISVSSSAAFPVPEVSSCDQVPMATAVSSKGLFPEHPLSRPQSSLTEVERSTDSSASLSSSASPLAQSVRSTNIDASVLELGKIAPVWLPDASAPRCMHCDARFTFTRRRHHCRACGKVFCSTCCNIKSKLQYLGNKEGRVCSKCHIDLLRAICYRRSLSKTATPAQSPCANFPSTSGCANRNNSHPALVTSSPSASVSVGINKSAAEDRTVSASEPDNNRRLGTSQRLHSRDEGSEASCSAVMGPTRIQNEDMQLVPDQFKMAAERTTTTTPVTPVRRPMSLKVEPRAMQLQADDGNDICDRTEVCTFDAKQKSDSSPFASNIADVSFHLEPMHSVGRDFMDQGISWAGAAATAKPSQLVGCEMDSMEESADMDLGRSSSVFGLPRCIPLDANVSVSLSLVILDCCVRRECWCLVTQGLCTVGQDEIVVVLERLPHEDSFPQDLLAHVRTLHTRATQGIFISDLDFTLADSASLFLGSKDHGGFLYVRPTFQCLRNLPLPRYPFLLGILIMQPEIAWAKTLPLRLLLRLGHEFQYYPCPLVSVRCRQPVYRDTDHSIVKLLHDANRQLLKVAGLHVFLEKSRTRIQLPRTSCNEVAELLKTSKDAGSLTLVSEFRAQSDSHLVSCQTPDGHYQTQAIRIADRQRFSTGASFVTFCVPPKSVTWQSKCSIVEDGILVQLSVELFVALRKALIGVADFSVTCEGTAGGEDSASVTVECVPESDTACLCAGIFSAVDGISLTGVKRRKGRYLPEARKSVDASVSPPGAMQFLLRCTDVFYVDFDRDSSDLPFDLAQLEQSISWVCREVLNPHLKALTVEPLSMIGVRLAVGHGKISCNIGVNGLPRRDFDTSYLQSQLAVLLARLIEQTELGIVLEFAFCVVKQT